MKAIGLGAIGAACWLLAWQFQAQAASKERVVYSFCPSGAFHCTDGAHPGGEPTDANGLLYGAASAGGGSNSGVIFAVDRHTGIEQAVHSFGNGNDGLSPRGSLVDVKGRLYGTAASGGGNGNGAVYVYDLAAGTEATVYGFCSQAKCKDGASPSAGLINVNGLLYGTTYSGGAHRGGVVFSFDPATGTETVIHAFGGGEDGQHPEAGLLNVKGTLYGVTSYGGSSFYGTVFSVDPKTGKEIVIHSFGSGTDGSMPKAALIEVNGKLYGTTMEGGTANDGSVFSIDPSTGAETVIHSFNNTDGQWPLATLINVKGVLYGTTYYGGKYNSCGNSDGCGTVFSLDPGTGVETVLHSFSGTDGATPNGGLIYRRGKFWGFTENGGTIGYGALFTLNIGKD